MQRKNWKLLIRRDSSSSADQNISEHQTRKAGPAHRPVSLPEPGVCGQRFVPGTSIHVASVSRNRPSINDAAVAHSYARPSHKEVVPDRVSARRTALRHVGGGQHL